MSGPSRSRPRLSPTVGSVLVFGGLAVLLVVAVVLAALALSPRAAVPAAGPRSTIGTADLTDAAFIGDSYTQGVGASGPESRWVTIVAVKEGWEPDNLGRSGTGYYTAGAPAECGQTKCPNYVDVVPAVISEKPDVVVVSGGQSDFDTFAKTPEAVVAAIDATYGLLRKGLPDTPIFAVGPSTTGPVSKQIIAFDAAVRSAAQRNGATYVSLIDPNVIKPSFIAADGVHVNDAGYAAIAARIEESIEK